MADLSATSDDMTPEERLDYLQERGIEVDLKDKDRKAGGNSAGEEDHHSIMFISPFRRRNQL